MSMPIQHTTTIDRDGDLLEALRRGEAGAVERLVAAYGVLAHRLAVRLTGNEHDAEEAVQDAFWKVVRKIDTFRGEAAFGSWVYRIVTNTALRTRRGLRTRRRDVSWDDLLPVFDEQGQHAVLLSDWSPQITDPARQTELRDALTQAIDALPETHRVPLILHDVEGLAYPEIAHVLGLSIVLVKARVHRARLFLRKRLGDVMAMPPACP